MYREKLDSFIENHKEEMLEDLKTLVRIDSQRGAAEEGKPFGEGPARALEAAGILMEKYGLKVKNYNNYVVTGDLGEENKKLDILAHLDVVPVTDNWKETRPFEPTVKDGRIYGRGTADDKGPAIAALYAMRAVKECEVPLAHSVRLILGADEECGSSDLEYYYAKEEEAEMTFTPDAEFPVINIEKGRLEKEFSREISSEGSAILQIEGGTKVNVVPDTARALLRGIGKEMIQDTVRKFQGSVSFTVEEEGENLCVTAKGLAAHASTPELGHNAICGLLRMLAELPLGEDPCQKAVREVARRFPLDEFGGESLGIAMEDEISGKLTMNLGILNYDGKTLRGTFDSRISICGSDETVTEVIRSSMAEAGFQMAEGGMIAPHHVPADSELVSQLLACYEDYTGKKGKTVAMGGGTYVHDLKRGVAFGCVLPEVDNHMHGDDEFMEISTLLMSAKIFADAIVRLCKEG